MRVKLSNPSAIRGPYHHVGQFVSTASIRDAAIATLEDTTWRALARDLTEDSAAGEMGRCTLRAYTFWGNRFLPDAL